MLLEHLKMKKKWVGRKEEKNKLNRIVIVVTPQEASFVEFPT